MEDLYQLEWCDSDGDNKKNYKTRDQFLKRLDDFLSRAYDCRIAIRAKDTVTEKEVCKLFNQYSHNYSIDDPDNPLKKALKGATSGAYDFSKETVVTVSGITVVKLGADVFAEIATNYGIDIAANTLVTIAEGADFAAEMVASFSPVGILISGAIKGYYVYRKAKKNEENAVLIFTFKKSELDASSYINSPFPQLSPGNG